MTEAGNRTHEVSSNGTRLVAGASGTLMGWDYEAALSRAENKAVDRYVEGYVLFDQFQAAVRDGRINPFGPSDAAGLALLNSIKINDAARSSKGVSTAIDAKVSRALTKLDGGDLAMALGGEFRRETTSFTPSALLTSNNIAGDRDSSGLSTDLAATKDSRKVASLFAEINAPFTKQIEAQFALRADKYSAVGDTFNPKIGLRWQPSKTWLVRTSAGTGFRAPSLADLSRPTTFGTTSSLLTDPQCVVAEGSIDACTDQWNVERRSNPNLKPEKSSQFSLGTVVEAMPGVSFSADYWNIQKKDVISTLGEQIIIESPDKYNGTYIERDADGFITNILLRKENQGRLKTSGIDLTADWRGEKGEFGRFSAGVSGTYILEYKRQFGPLEPALAPSPVGGLGLQQLRPDLGQPVLVRLHRPEHHLRPGDRQPAAFAQGQGLFAVGSDGQLERDPAAQAARRHLEPGRHTAAVFQPGLLLHRRLRPDLHRPAGPQLHLQRELQVLLSAPRAGPARPAPAGFKQSGRATFA
jgi:iron complex outermembrane receptor protein